jgi:hypothetical protein
VECKIEKEKEEEVEKKGEVENEGNLLKFEGDF